MLAPMYWYKLQDKVMLDGGMVLLQEKEAVINDLIKVAIQQKPDQFHHNGANGKQLIEKLAKALEVADKLGETKDFPEYMVDYTYGEKARKTFYRMI